MSALDKRTSGVVPSSGADAVPMLAPTMTSLPSMTTGRPISSMMRLANSASPGLPLAMAVEDDELVAAPAGDEVARADDAAEAPRDLRQELVAGGVAQAVVDLLEIVEVEKHHGEIGRGPVRTKRDGQLLLEAPAVWKVRDRIEPRHSIDLVLRVATFGDVLNDDDGAVAFHAVDGDFERPAVSGFERNDEIDPDLVVAKHGLRQAAELRRSNDAALAEAPEDRVDVCADEIAPCADAKNLERLVVGEDKPPARIDHAQTMRHVVERRVQAGGQRGGALLRRHHVGEVCSEPLRRALHVKNERKDSNQYPQGIPASGDDHRRGQRNERHEQLHVDAAVNRIAARHHVEGVGDGHRHADELGEAVFRHAERKQGPERKGGETGERAARVIAFLPACDFDRRAGQNSCMALGEINSGGRDHELRRSRPHQDGLSGGDGGGNFAGRHRAGRHEHRDEAKDKTIDKGDIDLVRQICRRRTILAPPRARDEFWPKSSKHNPQYLAQGLKSPLNG